MHPRSLLLPLALLLAAPGAAAAATPAASTQAEALLDIRHPAGLESFVRAVSDPSSPRYRQYLTVEQLTARFGAPAKQRARTLRYLRAHGLTAEVGPGGTYVLAQGTESALRRALPASAAPRAAGAPRTQLGVPAALRGTVTDAALLAAPPARPRAADADPYNGLPTDLGSALPHTGTSAGCPDALATQGPGGAGLTPNQYAAAYGLDVIRKAGFQGEGMHVALVETGGFNRGDIEQFASCFGSTMPKLTATNLSGKAQLEASNETTLDIQVLIASLPKLDRLDVYEAEEPKVSVAGDLLRATAAAIGTKGQHPDVISISYGLCEPLLLGQLGTVGTAHALDRVMQLAAASGISVTVSTGDSGYAGCARIVPAAIPAVAIPSTVPHVTAVGGTNLLLADDNHTLRESAWTDAPAGVGALGGGGGRSLLFARPWYQKAPGVSGYDRLVPDVSALADPVPGYVIYCTAPSCATPSQPQGGWQTVGGTSAATPLVASGIVLADQAARRAGQPPLGFVNPLVYALARGTNPGFVLNDVFIGSNDVGAALPADAGGGSASGFFKARKGYDEATGLGSLKFAALNALALRAGRKTAR